MVKRGTLYMLSTPIGHLGDFSFRGLEVLRQVAVVAAEDTRRTRSLLSAAGVPASNFAPVVTGTAIILLSEDR